MKSRIDRIFLIQHLIKKYRFTNYLEIGTQRGYSFFPIFCKKKVAVDPKFKISRKFKAKWLILNPWNWNNIYFEMTSEEFFANTSILPYNYKFDIVLIDGLHTFQATLTDIIESIKLLDKNGIIICHDCYPPHEAASIPAINSDYARINGSKLKGWNGEWCGDTWKAIVYLRLKYPSQMEVNVLNTDYGLGVIRNINITEKDLEIDYSLFNSINSLSYLNLLKDADNLLGLKNENFYRKL